VYTCDNLPIESGVVSMSRQYALVVCLLPLLSKLAA
jgi:hypothetical protein